MHERLRGYAFLDAFKLERVHVCELEAAHAVVAQKMGLPVEWVTVEPGCDEGLNFTAAVKIPDERIDRTSPDTLRRICVAMAAPVHFYTHREQPIGDYAQLEYGLALEVAGRAGIQAGEIYDESAKLFHQHYSEIIDLAQRLNAEGIVTFEEAVI
jgi:hypothetical protein